MTFIHSFDPLSSNPAGIFFVLPCIESYQKVDLRTITLGVPPQEVSAINQGCQREGGPSWADIPLRRTTKLYTHPSLAAGRLVIYTLRNGDCVLLCRIVHLAKAQGDEESRSGWLSGLRRCLPRRWRGLDSRSRPDLKLVWKRWLFYVTLRRGHVLKHCN
jgi:hypothetical protein